jgi:hypothetical protein
MLGPAEARLRQRQLALRLRSAELRQALRDDAEGLRPALDWGERGLRAARWLRGGPTPLRLGGLLLGVLALRRPARLLRWASLGLSVWRLLEGLRRTAGR